MPDEEPTEETTDDVAELPELPEPRPLNLAICRACDPPAVCAAGPSVALPTIHWHDQEPHHCDLVEGVDEQIPTTWPHTMTDGTEVADLTAWLLQLAENIE